MADLNIGNTELSARFSKLAAFVDLVMDHLHQLVVGKLGGPPVLGRVKARSFQQLLFRVGLLSASGRSAKQREIVGAQ